MTRSATVWRVALLASVALASCEGRKSTPTAPTPSCTPAISPEARAFPDAGGSGTVTVTVDAGCEWTATSPASWAVVTAGASGSGPGTVAYAVSEHRGADDRSAVLLIADRRHTVTQAGRPPVVCNYELSPTAVQFTKDGGDGAFEVRTAAGCGWTAASSAPWVTIQGDGRGTGSGQVRFTVERSRQTAPRAASIAAAGLTFTIDQAGDAGICTYEVSPVTWQPCMPAATLAATLRAPAGCSWTVRSTVPWLTIGGPGAGEGSATVAIAATENYDAPRSGVVEVRWPTPTAGQNIHVQQAGCRYAVSVPQIAMPVSGGPGTFSVIQQSDPLTCGGATQDRCVWRATADADWITITTSGPRTGDDRIAFVAAANPGPARTGRIMVRDQVVTITQMGR